MAHTVPNKGPPPRPIYPTACMYSVGRLRSLHADCRPVGTTRPNWGRHSGLGRPSNGQPTWPLAPHAVPWSGVDTGGGWVTGLGPQGCTRCPTDAAAWFRRGVACVLPHTVFTHHHNPKFHLWPPSSSSSCRFEPTVSGLDIRTSVIFLPLARRRQPADQVTVRSPWSLAASGICFLAVLFSGPCFPSFLSSIPPPAGVNHSCSLIPSPFTCL